MITHEERQKWQSLVPQLNAQESTEDDNQCFINLHLRRRVFQAPLLTDVYRLQHPSGLQSFFLSRNVRGCLIVHIFSNKGDERRHNRGSLWPLLADIAFGDYIFQCMFVHITEKGYSWLWKQVVWQNNVVSRSHAVRLLKCNYTPQIVLVPSRRVDFKKCSCGLQRTITVGGVASPKASQHGQTDN